MEQVECNQWNEKFFSPHRISKALYNFKKKEDEAKERGE